MVRKVSYILFFVSILANTFSCQMINRSRYKNCNDIIVAENAFSLIDTTQFYNIEDLTLKNRNHPFFCRFSCDGKIIFLFSENRKEYKHISKLSYRGFFYVKNKHLFMKIYFRHPQGEIRTKKILTAVCDGILYFRYEDECEKSIRLTPINAKYNQQ